MENQPFNKIQEVWGKKITYQYDTSKQGVYRKGYQVLENNDFIDGSNTSLDAGKYEFYFKPSQENGCFYECEKCGQNSCLNCSFKNFKTRIIMQMDELKFWVDPDFDDHKCLIKNCNNLSIDFDQRRNLLNKNTLLCEDHIGVVLDRNPKYYLEEKRSYYVTIYEKILKFLKNPLPSEIFILYDSDHNVVKATLLK